MVGSSLPGNTPTLIPGQSRPSGPSGRRGRKTHVASPESPADLAASREAGKALEGSPARAAASPRRSRLPAMRTPQGRGTPGSPGLRRAAGSKPAPTGTLTRVYTLPAPTPGPWLPSPPPWPPPHPPGRVRSRTRSSRRLSPSSSFRGSKCKLGAAAPGSARSARAALNPLRSRGAGSRSPAAAGAALSPPLAAAPAALTR